MEFFAIERLVVAVSVSEESGLSQWLEELALAANDHPGSEELKGYSAEDQGDKTCHSLEHASGLQKATGLQPCEGEPNDWNDGASFQA